MSEQASRELLELTARLLDSISSGDWETYRQLCDPTLTAFEPEGRGHLIEGLDFHKFYFDLGGHLGTHHNTIGAPHVRMLGDDAAVVSYTRLVQFTDADGTPQTSAFEETRVWQRRDDRWIHMHFHRS